MSASDFAESRIFVFERSFAVGFCPSIQMYSAVIFAKDVNLRIEISNDSRLSSRAAGGVGARSAERRSTAKDLKLRNSGWNPWDATQVGKLEILHRPPLFGFASEASAVQDDKSTTPARTIPAGCN